MVDYDEDGCRNEEINPKYLGTNLRNRDDNMNLGGNMNHVVRRGQNADVVLARMRVNQHGEHYQVTRIIEDILNKVKINVEFMNQLYFVSVFSCLVQMVEVPKDVKNPKIVTKFAEKVVKIATMSLDFYMRQKLLNVHIHDLAHLVERVRQVEILQKEKKKFNNEKKYKSKLFARKEKVLYVKMGSSSEVSDLKLSKIDLAKLKKVGIEGSRCFFVFSIRDAQYKHKLQRGHRDFNRGCFHILEVGPKKIEKQYNMSSLERISTSLFYGRRFFLPSLSLPFPGYSIGIYNSGSKGA
ncbi:hypothetical protein Ahy_B03g062549 [Arachis hypogaea]|uniref:Uncharacterized protein n=1 Tax=Arachis hypogaea TaxID=3818 RepID=A0A444ZUH0_ARAHY|nr:hypothetical protein Ahy_B03g062549 [Arachis hypogaea]